MQALAAAHAAGLAAGSGPAADPASPAFPFESLNIWRSKIQADLVAAGDKGGPAYQLRLLLEQGRDVEQAVLGCLKDALFELHESRAWGLLDPQFEQRQRQQLVNAAANELASDKGLVLELAREHGLLGRYAAELKKPAHRSLADYERVGELKFGLLVWRANLRRDLSLLAAGAAGDGGGGGDPLALQAHLEAAYHDALRLIQRCASQSQQYWAAQQAGGAPTQDSKRRLYDAAVQRVQNALLELAGTHPALDAAALHRLFEDLSDPDAVPPDAGDAGEEASGQEGGAYEPGDEALAGLEGGERGRRASSEESESSALGL